MEWLSGQRVDLIWQQAEGRFRIGDFSFGKLERLLR